MNTPFIRKQERARQVLRALRHPGAFELRFVNGAEILKLKTSVIGYRVPFEVACRLEWRGVQSTQ